MSVKTVLMGLPHEHTLPDASDYHRPKYISSPSAISAPLRLKKTFDRNFP